MIEREVMAGDTFPIVYEHKPKGQLQNLPEGYDYVIGLRPENGKNVTVYSYQNGDITTEETGIYRWKISHELSKSLKGVIIVEMVVYSRDGSVVRHCKEPIRLTILESFMNEHLDIE